MHTKSNDQEVYKITGFANIVESPVFYLVMILTFVLGISSIFGFLQNPRKLKSVVDVINKKVATYKIRSSRNKFSRIMIEDNKYSILYNAASLSKKTEESHTTSTNTEINRNRYSILSRTTPSKSIMQSNIDPVSFDYDITSKRFWSNLQLDSLDPNSRSSGSQFLGAPLDKVITLEEGDSKYSMAKGLKKSQVSL